MIGVNIARIRKNFAFAGNGHCRTSSWATVTSGTWMRYIHYEAPASHETVGLGFLKNR